MAVKRMTTAEQRVTIKKVKESFLKNLSEAQVENYIDTNVTDLASAKAFLKKLSKVILYLVKK